MIKTAHKFWFRSFKIGSWIRSCPCQRNQTALEFFWDPSRIPLHTSSSLAKFGLNVFTAFYLLQLKRSKRQQNSSKIPFGILLKKAAGFIYSILTTKIEEVHLILWSWLLMSKGIIKFLRNSLNIGIIFIISDSGDESSSSHYSTRMVTCHRSC